MDKVFVVILNWNGVSDTIECLNSIRELSIINYQLSIIVVDNASSDGSLEEIERVLKRVTKEKRISSELIKNKENLGFAAGNNTGIKHALKHEADFILLLNNDTLVDRGLVTGLLTSVKKYPKAGLISPKIYFAKGFEFHKKRYKKDKLGKVIWYAGGDIDWRNVYGVNHGVDKVDKGQFAKVQETDFATGACVFLRAKALREVGVFKKKYFMYFEDVDLSQRMKRKGWQVLYSPKGHLWHKVAQSSGIGSELNDYFITRNRMLIGLKYAPFRSKLALIKESVRLLNSGRKWQKLGVRDFYLGRFGKGSWKQ
ncbi:hypothetical protein A2686_00745 [Candidatus Woesebacteria bacterium RIFCSPHIGHO2_01_FULL_38_10]|uniref:Glycosyltransferase 2-like domain-containing protein n=1 Tax=Candidatus Woesebacteria bacterium RIFCSPLOWO2_01_FULL_39_10b TaxID=1802517 RepID=A0A1F8B9A4_9BACT|nr:MAG: hypothetical protein A2686_00745 [Candidatus Woesebacteria bacterium RIFCSPHIGHO2_01_FULL_38_10]OGM60634.1 MAG: hypothetical protein A2892_01140 [Candidatus Woesebacteria bacterium RIFCSPLOWO2_01_FULL_39_10b]